MIKASRYAKKVRRLGATSRALLGTSGLRRTTPLRSSLRSGFLASTTSVMT